MTVYRHAPENGGMGIHVEDFGFWYGDFHALSGVTMDVAPNKITAFIGLRQVDLPALHESHE